MKAALVLPLAVVAVVLVGYYDLLDVLLTVVIVWVGFSALYLAFVVLAVSWQAAKTNVARRRFEKELEALLDDEADS